MKIAPDENLTRQRVPRGFTGGRQIAIARSSVDDDRTILQPPRGHRVSLRSRSLKVNNTHVLHLMIAWTRVHAITAV